MDVPPVLRTGPTLSSSLSKQPFQSSPAPPPLLIIPAVRRRGRARITWCQSGNLARRGNSPASHHVVSRSLRICIGPNRATINELSCLYPFLPVFDSGLYALHFLSLSIATYPFHRVMFPLFLCLEGRVKYVVGRQLNRIGFF